MKILEISKYFIVCIYQFVSILSELMFPCIKFINNNYFVFYQVIALRQIYAISVAAMYTGMQSLTSLHLFRPLVSYIGQYEIM